MKPYYFLIFVLTFGISHSQVKLEGTVKDSLGNGLELANVIAINKSNNALDSYAITNSKGK